MEAEASAFETSEMVATFLASTPLVRESWRLCAAASFSTTGFVIEQIGHVGYLAFSSVQTGQAISDPNWARLVPFEAADDVVFGPLMTHGDGDGDGDGDDHQRPVMVHAGLLELFLSLFRSQALQHQILALKEKCKAVVITGHSLGGSAASLSALWLLCHSHLQSVSYSPSVLCISFGSPLLGNKSLSRAILRERWGGNFCHVVSKHDIMPRLLLAPSATLTPQMQLLLQYWHFSMSTTTSQFGNHRNAAAAQLGDQETAELFRFIMAYLENSSSEEAVKNLLFWPFGNYMLYSQEGAICLDNAASVIKMMHLMLMTGSPNDCIQDHLNYGEYVERVSSMYLKQRSFIRAEPPKSTYEAGLALALQSSGIPSQEPAATLAKDCLTMARRLGRTPRLKCAKLAVSLSKIVPYRAQIEWYKASCDESIDQMGYYDAFKRRGSTKRGDQVNMNRHKLAQFWDNVIELWESNQLPYDFHKRAKWVNACQSYKLLVEPLEIAEYYRKGTHLVKGHYLSNGRPRRFQVSDRWWKEGRTNEKENYARTKFTSATQDSCFWARLEEALEWLAILQSEHGEMKQDIWENISKFDKYSRRLVERKEVSKDVLAKNSSYTKWTEELNKLSSPLVSPAPSLPLVQF
ncbi:Lipase-like domain containing protein [Parasponia andersonii]|uniref:Lipase-like domain containing protein n=1 Tax=Parasponia andersonii TaxID=3476 RepID=A0A2P5BSI1_PARAD|nr:Lipase-like domain containing protein [Parasponia andersonii]